MTRLASLVDGERAEPYYKCDKVDEYDPSSLVVTAV